MPGFIEDLTTCCRFAARSAAQIPHFTEGAPKYRGNREASSGRESGERFAAG
jgi:hypothetical protein